MALVSRNILKSFFVPGATPTSAQFSTFIDSVLVYADDRNLVGLKTYDPTLIYVLGDTVIYNQIIYQANGTTTPGPFNISFWVKIAGSTPGSVTFKGTWDASTNTPDLNTIAKVTGDFYIVSVAGTTPLNNPPHVISNWQVGDWAIYDGSLWGKVNNNDAVNGATNVAGSGAGVYKDQVNTILEFKRITNIGGSINVNDGTDTIDLSVNFNDAGVSANNSWSSFKINSELNTKEPFNTNIQAHIADVTTNPHNVTKAQVGLGNVLNTKVNFSSVVDPSATDDNTQGYSPGSTWLNILSQKEFTCMDSSVGAAIWQMITANPNIQAHISDMNNPHNTTKAQVGLGNVENIKVNLSAITAPSVSNDSSQGYSIGSVWINTLSDKQFSCLDASSGAAVWIELTPNPNIQAHIADMNNPHNTTKAQVGLGNVDNTSDINKPVSTAQAAADAVVLSSANSYADSLVVGLLNDRGNYDASGNVYPSTGGSGTGGTIKKGDLWTTSVAGTLGGVSVEVGDLIRALVNTPGQTSSNWAITQNNIGYVPENSANKVSTLSALSTNVEYTGAKLVYDELASKEPTISGTGNAGDFWNGTKTFSNLGNAVRSTVLSGLNLATNQVISATDTILQAFGYLQKQISDNLSALSSHIANTSNPHNVTKSQVGLGNADNTSDINKPVSTAQAAADAAVLSSANSYADSLVVGLLDDRGNYDASGNVYPSTGGSGTGGAVNKGDLWTVSVAGTLGGQSVVVGDIIRALVNTPGQTSSNWAITQNNIGYVAENSANKVTSISGSSTNIQYPGAKLVFDQLATKEPVITGTGSTADFWSGAKTFRNLASDVRAVTLTGLNLATNQVISASNTILQAFGFLQKQVSDNLSTLTSHTGNTSNPHNVTQAQVGLSNVQNIKVNYTAVSDPTPGDGSGYSVGSTWINTVTAKEFVCMNATPGAAVWKELTNPAASVFGNDYLSLSAQSSVMNSSGTFSNYTPSLTPNPGTLMLSTGTRSGTYRIQWSCVTGNTSKKVGEIRFVDYTNPASPSPVGLTLSFQFNQDTDRLPFGGTADVVLSGTNKDYIIQFREVTGGIQTVFSGRIEIFRVS